MGWNPPETNRQNHFAHKRWRVVTRPSTTPINRQAIGTRDHATKFMCEVISSVGFWWRLAVSSGVGEGIVVYRMVLVLCVRWAFVCICVFVVVFYETIPSHLYIMGWNPPETNRQNHFAHKRWRVVTRPSTTPINRQAIGTRDHATKFMCEVISSVGFWWRLALSLWCGGGHCCI